MKIQSKSNVNRSLHARNLLFERAREQEKQGAYKKALEFYRMSLKIDKDFFDSWLNAGAIYSRMGKRDKAIVCYQRALLKTPDKRAFYNLASEYFKDERYKESKKALQSAIRLDNRFLQAHLLLGYTYGKLDQNEKAEISIKNVLKVDGNNRSAMTALALLYFHTDRLGLCEKIIARLLAINPEDGVTQRLKANLSLKGGDVKESIIAFRDLAEKDTKLQDFYRSLNSTQRPEQKRKMAIKKKGLVAKPKKEARDWLDLSLLTFFEGDPQTALDYLLEATEQSQAKSA